MLDESLAARLQVLGYCYRSVPLRELKRGVDEEDLPP